MNAKNPYEKLKLDHIEDVESIPSHTSHAVATSSEETVDILTAQLPSGVWVYGYSVYWKDGRHSFQLPSDANGFFATEREAQLYCVGFFKAYFNYFTYGSRSAISAYEGRLQQSSLF